jgi:superfamily II DNA or RNA helicase
VPSGFLGNKTHFSKTHISAGVILDHDFKKHEKILLIVPNVSLVDQMANDFLDYGYNKPDNIARVYYGQDKNFNKQIIISTWQSIHNYHYEWFEQFQCLIVDETHKSKADRLQYVTENCINARFRLGTTGTLQQELLERYQVIANLGYPFTTKSTIELVDEGYLSPFMVKNIVLKWKTKEKMNFSDFDEEYTTVLES